MAASKVMLEAFMGFLVLMGMSPISDGAISKHLFKLIKKKNKKGPFLGVVVPNAYEMNPLLSSCFVADRTYPYLDLSGVTTQLLLSLFRVKGIIHYGIAGNANTNLQIGDVTIPEYWAHTGLWNWQRYGDGPDDELALESKGDYTRTIGYLKFSDYTNGTQDGEPSENLLNNVWYQPEEIFPVDGIPEERGHAFWVPVDKNYLSIAARLKCMKLKKCINSTACLPRKPIVTEVSRRCTANAFIDNAAYRQFLYSKFNVTAFDMESGAVALICFQQKTPFIAFRSLSDLAGGGSALSNEATIFDTCSPKLSSCCRKVHLQNV